MTGPASLSEVDPRRSIGTTTTVPVEAIYAAGLTPVDLNNVFIASDDPESLILDAEQRGFPRNSCAWTKGVYGAIRRLGLQRVVAVVQGDCSSTHAMAEVLTADGVAVVPFSFPYEPGDAAFLENSLRRFCGALETTRDEAERWKARLEGARAAVHRIDELAWSEDRVSGRDLHRWTISCSDFEGDPGRFERDAALFAKNASSGPKRAEPVRLALIGIPPICSNLFEFVEERGARIVFDEIPRQFSMPFQSADLCEQYLLYTYPYDVFRRIEDILAEFRRRRIHGVIHYVQSFCHRLIQDPLIRERLPLPVLTLEGDRPGPVDMRTETRIEAFLELLAGGQRVGSV